MKPRPPNKARSGPRPVVVANGRGASPLLQIVQQRMAGDELWNIKSDNDLWICPFCLGGVAKRPGLGHLDAVARHLENCRSFALGKGQIQSRERIEERRTHENIIHAAQQDPAWKIYDSDGTWISPFSLQRVPAVRMAGGKLDNFLYQAMAKHLSTCAFYRQATAHSADEVLLARELHRRIVDIGRYVAYQLHMVAAWRYTDANGSWLCPFTLFAVPQVRLGTAVEWQLAPSAIALHLITHCPRFATGQVQPHPEAVVAQAAGPHGRAVVPPTASVPTPISTTQILGTATRSGLALLSPTPTGQPVSAGSATSSFTNRIAPPMTLRPAALPAATPPRSPAAGQATGMLFSRTPLPGNARIAPPLVPPVGGAPPLSVPAARPVAPSQLAALEATPPSSAETAPDAQQDDLGWMDDADSGGFETVNEAAAQRTDVIHARQLQEKLLQQAPHLPGFRIATRFEPCADITGDFFVFIPLSDGRTGFAIGDVSGHGVQAGLIMSMAKKTLEIYAAEGHGPADTLARVNDALVSDLGGKMFISMCYAVLDPDENTITWARAGHNPSLGYNIVSGKCSEIRPKGMVVGMKSGQVFRQSLEEEITVLEPGDTFLLYTDGITETMNRQGEEFGTERLTEVLKQFSGDGPDVVVEQITERLRHFRGPRPAADDATMVALLVE